MKLEFRKSENGVLLNADNKLFSLEYPREIWDNYPSSLKELFLDNFSFISTIVMPLVAEINEVDYNTSKPLFEEVFRNSILKDIPSAVEDYKDRSEDVINKFLKIKYNFKDKNVKKPELNNNFDERAVLSMSYGKDSLASLGVCREVGLESAGFYVNDCVSPSENEIKIEFSKKISEEFNVPIHVIKNEIEKINDFEYWKKEEGCLSYSHLIAEICFLSSVLNNFYKAKYFVMGNENGMTKSFVNKDGYKCYISYDQSPAGMERLNKMMNLMGSRVGSVILPLDELSIIKILHNRYKELGKYQTSCNGLDNSDRKRWCLDCDECAIIFLLLKANNIDVKSVGLEEGMFDKKFKKFFILFGGTEVSRYHKIDFVRDEELLAFYLAYRNKARGYLIDKFKERFLEEAKEREDELYKNVFSAHKVDLGMSKKIEKEVWSIYREELSL